MTKKQPPPQPPDPGSQGAEGAGRAPKRYKTARIRQPLAGLLEQLALRRATDMTEEANRAVRELLEREGLWPPPEQL